MPAYPLMEAKAVGGLDAVIDVAQTAAGPHEVELGKYHVILAGGQLQRIDLTGDQYQPLPARKAGTVSVYDVPSFLAYFKKHGDENSEVYADVQARTVTAVLDAHAVHGPRWGKHRLVLALRPTTAWTTWTNRDGDLMSQGDFAHFIADNLTDLIEPAAATMLEIAESFQATTKASFESSTRLASGGRKFAYSEDTDAKAGHKGDLTIPDTMRLALRPFEGSAPYDVTARFRYRLDKTELRLGFKLERPDDVLAAAFSNLRNEIDGDIEQPVLSGKPTSTSA